MTVNIKNISWLFYLCFCGLALLIYRQPLEKAPQQDILIRSQIMMGDILVSIHVPLAEGHSEQISRATSQAFARGRALEDQLSHYNPASEVSRLNQSHPIEWQTVSPELYYLLEASTSYKQQTSGYFDVAYQSPPQLREIELAKETQSVRFQSIQTKLDLHGLAKGYILEAMGKVLLQQGQLSFLINGGGDMVSRGAVDWLVELENPLHPGESFCTFTMRNQSLASSGHYARGAHITNPRAAHESFSWAMVSVITGGPGEYADALATALFAAGSKGVRLAHALVNDDPQLGILFVDKQLLAKRVGAFPPCH